jgi:hypothetical protein
VTNLVLHRHGQVHGVRHLDGGGVSVVRYTIVHQKHLRAACGETRRTLGGRERESLRERERERVREIERGRGTAACGG